MNLNKSINLIQTFLVLDIESSEANLQSKFEFIPIKNKPGYQKLQLSLYEVLKIEDALPTYKNTGIETAIHSLVKDGQYINPKSLLAQVKIVLNNA